MINFAWSFVFFALPLPFFIRLLFPVSKRNIENAIKMPFFRQIKALERARSKRWSFPFVLFLLWLCLITALARPQIPEGVQAYTVPVRDIMLALDISGSMSQKDFVTKNANTAERLDAVRNVAIDFVQKRKGDRIGVVLFAKQASLYVPLTVDYKTVQTMLVSIKVGLLGSVTAIGDAVGLSVDYLKRSKAQHKIVILLTDGVNNAGSLAPLDALKLAKENNVTLYTIGVGTPNETNYGIDLALLQKMATQTNGEFFLVENADMLFEAYDKISQQHKTSQTTLYLMPQKELYPYPLSVFLCIISFYILKRSYFELRFLKRQKK